MGPIFLGGHCSIGKNALTFKVSQALMDRGIPSVSIQDPADTTFRKYFGMTLPRALAVKMFISQPHEFFKASMEYLNIFEKASKDKESIAVLAESPSLAISHALFFGVLSMWSAEEKKSFWGKAYELLDTGTHFLVEGWRYTPENNLRWGMQCLLSKDKANIKAIGPYRSFMEVQEKGLRDILEVIL